MKTGLSILLCLMGLLAGCSDKKNSEYIENNLPLECNFIIFCQLDELGADYGLCGYCKQYPDNQYSMLGKRFKVKRKEFNKFMAKHLDWNWQFERSAKCPGAIFIEAAVKK